MFIRQGTLTDTKQHPEYVKAYFLKLKHVHRVRSHLVSDKRWHGPDISMVAGQQPIRLVSNNAYVLTHFTKRLHPLVQEALSASLTDASVEPLIFETFVSNVKK